jgi:hypothetical protein
MAKQQLGMPSSGTLYRQQRQRVAGYLDCTWQSTWGHERSRISSISPTGCYIEDRFTVPASGDVVRDLSIALPTEMLNLEGTVLDATRGIGFAVRFTNVDPETVNRLSLFVQSARRRAG